MNANNEAEKKEAINSLEKDAFNFGLGKINPILAIGQMWYDYYTTDEQFVRNMYEKFKAQALKPDAKQSTIDYFDKYTRDNYELIFGHPQEEEQKKPTSVNPMPAPQ